MVLSGIETQSPGQQPNAYTARLNDDPDPLDWSVSGYKPQLLQLLYISFFS